MIWFSLTSEVPMVGKPKTVPFTLEGIAKLPNDKPAVYTITSKGGDPAYIGSAKRGRVEERLKEHLPGGPDPVRGGAKVHISQAPSIKEAQAKETRAINREQPPQNKKGK
jgi:hypothetical protein